MAKDAMYLEVYKTIKDWILDGKYADGDLLPTEKELGEEFYTSRITIQKAMQLLTKEGYVKRIAGRGTFVDFTKPRTATQNNVLGVILCNIGSSFGTTMLESIEKQAAKLGYSIIFKNTYDNKERETEAINEVVNLGVRGIIIQPVHGEYYNERIIQLQLNKFPIVLVDRHFAGFPITSVCTDNVSAAEEAAQYLFDYGHDSIGFISFDPQNTSSIADRINGFKSAFLKNNKLITPDNMLINIKSPAHIEDRSIWDSDVENIINFLQANKHTALIASEFTVAQLIVQSVKAIHKTIPDNYSFLMFDEVESLYDSNLTHIRQDQRGLGKMAVKALIKKLDNEIVSDKIYIPYSLIEGSTVKKLTATKN